MCILYLLICVSDYSCYEIMATPYSLNPGQCGHTFCALCILKWFFSRLHNACGSWHESVDCPICRSVLTLTADVTPRPNNTFPFVPNRTAAAVLESLIEKLTQSRIPSTKVKREHSEGLGDSGSRKRERENDCVPPSKLDASDETINIAGWREGGAMRAEWLKKDRCVDNLAVKCNMRSNSLNDNPSYQRRQTRNGSPGEGMEDAGIA